MSSPALRKADVVANDLLTRIVSGRFAVGSLLPREEELAERYGVNRGVVREAVKLLEVHGLVRPIRRRGTVVRDPARSLSPEVLKAMLRPDPDDPERVDADVLASVLEVRSALDLQMTRLAAERRTDADLAVMDALLDQLAQALDEPETYDRLVTQLTFAVAEATHNPVFVKMAAWNELVLTDLEAAFRVMRASRKPHLQGMILLVQHLRARDADAAVALVQVFHRYATPNLLAAARATRGG